MASEYFDQPNCSESGRDWLSRRDLLKRTVVGVSTSLAASVLAACGGNNTAPTPTTSGEATVRAASTTVSSSANAVRATTGVASATTGNAASASADTPVALKHGGMLVVGLSTDPRSMDPAATGEPQARTIRGCVTESLFDLDAKADLIPKLAESWEQIDPTTYAIHLRKGIKFTDGMAFDASAVKFNFDRMVNPATKNVWASEITQLDSMEVVDTFTVRLKTKQPFAPALIPLYDVNGMQLSPAAVERWGSDIGTHPIGTGPFKFVEYAQDDHVLVERNPDYWQQGLPYLDQIRFRVITNDSTRETELRSGGAHIVEYLPFQDIDRLKAMNGIVVSEKPGFRVDWLNFQAAQPPGTNKAFRQAWNWLIDRDAIQTAVYNNTGSPAWDLFLPGSQFYDPQYKPAQRDVTKAKDLLKQSGVSSMDLSLQIGQDPVSSRTAQILQANVAEAGINLKVEVLESAQLDQRGKAGDFMTSLSWWGFRPDPDQYLPVNIRTNGSWNWARYSNPQVDSLLQDEETAQDPAQRKKDFRQIAQIMTDDAVIIPFHYGSVVMGMTNKVQGFEARVDGLIRFTSLGLQ